MKQEQELVSEIVTEDIEVIDEKVTNYKVEKHRRRKFTFGEELANTITHGVSAIMVLIMMPIAYLWTFTHAKEGYIPLAMTGVAIFCISIFLMFLTSTIYHAMKDESKHQEVMHILDHIFIFVAIAGTYTPIALYVIGGWQGWVVVAIQWTIVIVGILYKTLVRTKGSKASTIIYLIMGWSIIWFLPEFLSNTTTSLGWLILAGGLCYSIGAFFYSKRNWPYTHMVWHLFILAAATCHFIGVCFFMF